MLQLKVLRVSVHIDAAQVKSTVAGKLPFGLVVISFKAFLDLPGSTFKINNAARFVTSTRA